VEIATPLLEMGFTWPHIRNAILSTGLAVAVILIILRLAVFNKCQFIPKHKLRFPGHQLSWVIESLSDCVLDFSPRASSAMEAAKETKFGTKVA